MYGAILGDMIGSPYEFDMGDKTKDFPLFSDDSYFTDDTVMTIAVAEAFLDAPDDEDTIRQRLIQSMQKWGHRYPAPVMEFVSAVGWTAKIPSHTTAGATVLLCVWQP